MILVYVVQDADVPWWLLVGAWLIYGCVTLVQKITKKRNQKIKNK